MINGRASSNDAMDEQSNEASMLLDTKTVAEQDSYGTTSLTESGEQTPTSIEHELDAEQEEISKPWPATFERSAEILAKPIVGRALVEKATESVHILPPTKLHNNTLSNLNRGWLTPDPVSKPAFTFGRNEKNLEDEEKGDGIFHRMGLSKIPSLDWRFRPGGPMSKTQQNNVFEIKAHRQTVLETLETLGVEDRRGDTSKKRMVDTNENVDDYNFDDGSKTSIFGCICNVANTLLGIGILSLPYVFKEAGWLGGLFAIITFGVVAWWTSILLGRELNGDPRPTYLFERSPNKNNNNLSGRMRTPITSFPAIAREAFGQQGTILLSAVMYFELFSCLAVFLVSMGDHLHTLFPEMSMTNHMMFVSALLMLTTVLLKTPRLISYLSVVGTFTTISVVVSVFTTALWEGNLAPEIAQQQLETSNPTHMNFPPYHSSWITAGLPIGYGLVAYCFSCHAVLPTIYNTMASPHHYENMISMTFILVVVCCIMVAAGGYYMFGSTVSDQITISLHDALQSDAQSEMMMLTWLMIVTCFSKFSLYLFPLALGLEEILAPFIPTERAMELSYTMIKFMLIVSALFVAVFIPSFSFLCSLVGLVCSVVVGVIFPAAAHLKLFGSRLPVWEKCVDWMFVGGGAAFAVVGTIATLQ